MKNTGIIFTLLLISSLAFLTPIQAQVEQVKIRVDGLACPFCAYGLEKKLKDVEGVANVRINVGKGIAALQNKQGKSIAVERLEAVVADAGFTPREITATVSGQVDQSDGTPVLTVPESEIKFILKENEALKKLQSKLAGADTPVRITGRLRKETPEGHHAHPYTLTVEEFAVVP